MMKRIGMPTSDDTILRYLKRRAKERRAQANVRVVGIDDWAWRKGSTYGTIIVDLERREVIDLLPVRSAGATADWLKQHPEIEMISRDRCEGAPQARQVALVQILERGHIARKGAVRERAFLCRALMNFSRVAISSGKLSSCACSGICGSSSVSEIWWR
jgi:transposase